MSTCVFLGGDVYTRAEAAGVVRACVFMTGNVKTCADVGGVVNEGVLEVISNANPGGTRL